MLTCNKCGSYAIELSFSNHVLCYSCDKKHLIIQGNSNTEELVKLESVESVDLGSSHVPLNTPIILKKTSEGRVGYEKL